MDNHSLLNNNIAQTNELAEQRDKLLPQRKSLSLHDSSNSLKSSQVSLKDSSVLDIPDMEDQPKVMPNGKVHCRTRFATDVDSSSTTDSNESLPAHMPGILGLAGMDLASIASAFMRKRDRLISKNGECRIVYTKIDNRGLQYLIDFFTTLLELKWRYHFLMFFASFSLSWVFFAFMWWAIYAIDSHIHNVRNPNGTEVDYEPCVIGVTDFQTALLFSIETQHTIGYGTRAMTSACHLATAVLMLQSMVGAILQCVLTGIIFAKMARPKLRAQTVIFSENAVINTRDGQKYLMFRVGDMRRAQVIDCHINVMLVRRGVTEEGEYLPIMTQDLPVTTESGSSFIFLAWPVIIMHKIDEESPLFGLSSSDIRDKDWEVIVVLEGVDEITGNSFQVRTSYLPNEILWGYKLRSLLTDAVGGFYKINFTDFHEREPVDFTAYSLQRQASLCKKIIK